MKKIILLIFCTLPIFGVFGDDSSANKVIVKETPEKLRVINGQLSVEFGLSKKQVGRNTSIQFAGKNYLFLRKRKNSVTKLLKVSLNSAH